MIFGQFGFNQPPGHAGRLTWGPLLLKRRSHTQEVAGNALERFKLSYRRMHQFHFRETKKPVIDSQTGKRHKMHH